MSHMVRERFEAPDKTFVGHRDIVTRSTARYRFVAPHLDGVTLDIGCGRGYGFEVIEPEATRIVGIDVSKVFLIDARTKFASVPVVNATGDVLPFSSDSFDSIIALDVIEHIQDDRVFLAEIRRVARRDAFVAISTPNRRVASGSARRPLNRFHVREYCLDELESLLYEVFSSVDIYGQVENRAGDGPRTSLARLVDCIPMRLKYLLPAHFQDLLSVSVRPPLRLEDTRFEREQLQMPHTYVALCRL